MKGKPIIPLSEILTATNKWPGVPTNVCAKCAYYNKFISTSRNIWGETACSYHVRRVEPDNKCLAFVRRR